MKRVDTIVMTVLVLFSLGVLLHQAIVPVHPSQDDNSVPAPHGQTAFVQTEGFVALSSDHCWTITTRKYKPRSTQPVRITEEYIAGSFTIIDPNENGREGKKVGMAVAASRAIPHPVDPLTLRTTVERTIFTMRIHTQTVLTA